MSAASITPPGPGGGNVVRVSVWLPRDVVREVRARVGPGQFSRYVAGAAGHQLRLQMLGEIVDDYAARHGPLPGEVTAEVDEEWREILGSRR